MDVTTRQVIAFHVGDRSGQSAEALWAKNPGVYQERATFYTDQGDDPNTGSVFGGAGAYGLIPGPKPSTRLGTEFLDFLKATS